MTDQPNQMPVSTCPRTDRHGYHMWPERPDAPAFCPGHPAPDTAADHAYQDAVTAPLSDRDVRAINADVRAINARLALGIDTRTMKASARTTADNPATSGDTADNSGRATVTVAGGGDGLRDLYAAAIDRLYEIGGIYAIEDAERYRVADAIMAVRDSRMEQLAVKVADYEHRIGWDTTCQSCARILDSAYSETVRAERAEAALAQLHVWLSAEAAHHRAAAPRCRIPEGAQAQDGMGAGLDIAAHAVQGLIAGWGLPVTGRGGDAGEAPASGHGEGPNGGGDGR